MIPTLSGLEARCYTLALALTLTGLILHWTSRLLRRCESEGTPCRKSFAWRQRKTMDGRTLSLCTHCAAHFDRRHSFTMGAR